MNCPNCGKIISNDALFCPFCNINLNQVQTQLQNQQIERPLPQINDFQNIHNGKKLNKSKKFLIGLGITIVIILLIVSIIIINNFRNKSSNTETISKIKADNGIVKFIDGNFTNIKVKNKSDAFRALDSLKKDLKFNDVNKEFDIESVETSENITYYKFHQKYKDILLYGINLIISVNSNNDVLGMSGYYIPNINVDTNNKKTEAEIKDIVKKDLGENSEISSSEKYIYADNNNQKLVFVVNGYNNESIFEYMVDANSGKIINKVDNIDYADAYNFKGYGHGDTICDVTIEKFYDVNSLKTRYRLVDPNRNIVIADGTGLGPILGTLVTALSSSWNPMIGDVDGYNFKYGVEGNEKYVNFSKDTITTLKNYGDIYDYYLKVLKRKSYDNNGAKIVVTVGIWDSTLNLKKEKWNNACWNSLNKQFMIGYSGDILYGISKDVIGHEFTHAVIEKTANFASTPKEEDNDKAFETGALNEGISDIMGSLIEGQNWTINESINTLRNLENPNEYSDAAEKGGKYYYPDYYVENGTINSILSEKGLSKISEYDKGGVHQNSTVVGHAAYLMYANGAFDSREQMARVWYNSLFSLSSYSNFEDCALAVIKTAKNMGLSENSLKIIKDAFISTNMLYDEHNEDKKENNINKTNTNTNIYNIVIDDPDNSNVLMVIDDIFTIAERGTVVTGLIARGTISVNDSLDIVGYGNTFTAVVNRIEANRESKETAKAGENVGIFLTNVDRNKVRRGQILAKPNSIKSSKSFEANINMFEEKQNGSSSPIVNNDRLEYYFRNTIFSGTIELSNNIKSIKASDSNISINVKLDDNVALEIGTKFYITEFNRAIGEGIVTKIN